MIAASALRETDRRNIVTHFWNQLSDLQNLRPGVISNVRIFRLLSRHSLLCLKTVISLLQMIWFFSHSILQHGNRLCRLIRMTHSGRNYIFRAVTILSYIKVQLTQTNCSFGIIPYNVQTRQQYRSNHIRNSISRRSRV